MAPLAALAERTDVAILGIMHLAKSAHSDRRSIARSARLRSPPPPASSSPSPLIRSATIAASSRRSSPIWRRRPRRSLTPWPMIGSSGSPSRSPTWTSTRCWRPGARPAGAARGRGVAPRLADTWACAVTGNSGRCARGGPHLANARTGQTSPRSRGRPSRLRRGRPVVLAAAKARHRDRDRHTGRHRTGSGGL